MQSIRYADIASGSFIPISCGIRDGDGIGNGFLRGVEETIRKEVGGQLKSRFGQPKKKVKPRRESRRFPLTVWAYAGINPCRYRHTVQTVGEKGRNGMLMQKNPFDPSFRTPPPHAPSKMLPCELAMAKIIMDGKMYPCRLDYPKRPCTSDDEIKATRAMPHPRPSACPSPHQSSPHRSAWGRKASSPGRDPCPRGCSPWCTRGARHRTCTP